MLLTRKHKGTPHSVPAASPTPNEDVKYHANKPHKQTRSHHNEQNQRNCHFWSWILCGVLCSFLSLEYTLRSHRLVSSNAPAAKPPLVVSDSILMPLRSLNLNASPLTTKKKEGRHIPSSFNDDYRFDSLTNVKPDPNQHAILIPYRDRTFHLSLFLEYMGPYLQHHFPHAQFTLWVIEQDDAELFNRAWLANVGLREIVKSVPQTSCVIFHDVDLVPNRTSHVPYTTCQYPMQLGSELQHFNWTVPYPAYCGGITSLSLKHWQLINGLGNDYIGWGGEDDDLYHRLRQNGLLMQPTWSKDAAPIPRRPPKGQGVFRTISQRAEHHEQKKSHNNYWKTLELLREMHENSDRWKFDGMSDAYYTVTSIKSTHPELGFAQYKHIKAMPQKLRDGTLQYHQNPAADAEKPQPPLEFVHVPFTAGQAVTKAAAHSGYIWAACHYGAFRDWDCPPHTSGDFQHTPFQIKASYHQAQKPWHIPLSQFLENPMEGTKRFTIVRHPYSRAISFYRYEYDRQHGYPHGYKYHSEVNDPNHPPAPIAKYLREREHPDKLNAFLQEFLIRAHHPHVPDGVELLPQVNFVYHRGLKYVHHVLHYEFLQRDFKNILEKYEMVDAITLPPPERKRKRKKQYVKTYKEKRVPQITWTWTDAFLQPLRSLLGQTNDQPQVVDMSLAEIEDEYLLGAQDLAEETIAMLNSHYELDFKKFHYAKIKVNATTDAYWNPIQVIPRESTVAKQQNDRNAALNKAKGTPQAQTVAQAAPKAPPQKAKPEKVSKDDKKKSKGGDKKEETVYEQHKQDPLFRDRKKKLEERLNAKLAENAAAKNAEKKERQDDTEQKVAAAMMNMRRIAQKYGDADGLRAQKKREGAPEKKDGNYEPGFEAKDE